MNLDDTLDGDRWKYIGSGAANVVLAYNGECSLLKGKVIRLRLKNTDVSTGAIYKYLNSKIFDRLREYMVNVSEIKITEKFFTSIQTYLTNKNINLQLDLTETTCLIMKNIFSSDITDYKVVKLSKYLTFFVQLESNEIIFEFKPKWLYKMPTDHVNCRNCLIARSKGQEFIPCHLKLVNDNPTGIEEWCSEISLKFEEINEYSLEIGHLLKNCVISNFNVILTLYELQNNMSIHDRILSLNSQDDVDEDLQFNMTLRDCSIFMNLTRNEVYILDLDKKSPVKWKKWKSQEEKLQKYYKQELKLNCRIKTNS